MGIVVSVIVGDVLSGGFAIVDVSSPCGFTGNASKIARTVGEVRVGSAGTSACLVWIGDNIVTQIPYLNSVIIGGAGAVYGSKHDIAGRLERTE